MQGLVREERDYTSPPRNCNRGPGEALKGRSQELMMMNTTDKEATIEWRQWSILRGLPGGTMDGQLTKVQPKMETQKNKNRQEGAEGSCAPPPKKKKKNNKKQVMMPCQGSAPEPVFRPGTMTREMPGSPERRTVQHHGRDTLE